MATAAQLLDGEAFNQLVLEKDLRPWEQNGYIYAGYRGPNGWELYRAYGPRWMIYHQARRVNTQSAGGRGALGIRLTVPAGMLFKFVRLYVLGPLSNTTLIVRSVDEDGATGDYWASLGAAVTNVLSLPAAGSNASTGGNMASNGANAMLLGPGEGVQITAAAALQTETLTVAVQGLFPSSGNLNSSLTWATTGSAGTPTLAASTISQANTNQWVLMPCP